MNWTLRILAFVALVATVSKFTSPISTGRLTGSFIAGTAVDLALAVGVVALVDAAQRHRRGWFARLLGAVLVTAYGPFVFATVLPYTGIQIGLFSLSYMLVSLATQAVTPLVALLYTLPPNNIKYV